MAKNKSFNPHFIIDGFARGDREKTAMYKEIAEFFPRYIDPPVAPQYTVGSINIERKDVSSFAEYKAMMTLLRKARFQKFGTCDSEEALEDILGQIAGKVINKYQSNNVLVCPQYDMTTGRQINGIDEIYIRRDFQIVEG